MLCIIIVYICVNFIVLWPEIKSKQQAIIKKIKI